MNNLKIPYAWKQTLKKNVENNIILEEVWHLNSTYFQVVLNGNYFIDFEELDKVAIEYNGKNERTNYIFLNQKDAFNFFDFIPSYFLAKQIIKLSTKREERSGIHFLRPNY